MMRAVMYIITGIEVKFGRSNSWRRGLYPGTTSLIVVVVIVVVVVVVVVVVCMRGLYPGACFHSTAPEPSSVNHWRTHHRK